MGRVEVSLGPFCTLKHKGDSMRPSRKMQRHIVAFGAAILLVFVVLIANILRILVVKGDELE